ncbi:MAG: cation diffusion facilitator family transporter [Alphaproteobacteria bacterium]|jgi:cation diffusion facilitator family transporter
MSNRDQRADRDRSIQRIIILEGLANLAVLLAKLAVGLSTGSLAVLGDAVHSLTDVTNNVVAWIVVRHSTQPADRRHPYGHRKFETLAVFGLAALLTVLAFELALRAIKRETIEVSQNVWGLGIMLGVLCVNIGIASWQRYWARRLQSDILLADANHTFADVLTTVVVIAGWQLSAFGYPWLDTICAIGVAIVILYLAYGLFKRALPVLLDEMSIDPEHLLDEIQEVPGVRGVQRVRSRWIGSSRAVDMVIDVDAGLTTAEAHDITDAVETLLEERFDVRDISIHVEPHG